MVVERSISRRLTCCSSCLVSLRVQLHGSSRKTAEYERPKYHDDVFCPPRNSPLLDFLQGSHPVLLLNIDNGPGGHKDRTDGGSGQHFYFFSFLGEEKDVRGYGERRIRL
jgi:hypothetical protein